MVIKEPPQKFYAIRWRSRKEPKYSGIVWANGNNLLECALPAPFSSLADTLLAAEKLAVNQETEIICWELQENPSKEVYFPFDTEMPQSI